MIFRWGKRQPGIVRRLCVVALVCAGVCAGLVCWTYSRRTSRRTMNLQEPNSPLTAYFGDDDEPFEDDDSLIFAVSKPAQSHVLHAATLGAEGNIEFNTETRQENSNENVLKSQVHDDLRLPVNNLMEKSGKESGDKDPFVNSPFNLDNWRYDSKARRDMNADAKTCSGLKDAGVFKPRVGLSSSSNGGNSGSKKKLIGWQASKSLSITNGASDMFQGCPNTMCTLSTRKEDIPYADAVVYDDYFIVRQNPPPRDRRQIFVYYSFQPTAEVRHKYFFPAWRVGFNWTWSYRVDSDIFQPSAFLNRTTPPHPLSYYRMAAERKTKLAAYIDDHGHKQSQSKEEEFIRALHKVVDLKGFPAFSADDKRIQLFERYTEIKDRLPNYFFLLSFEKNLCQDFIGDSLFDIFDPAIQAIPVVRGGTDYHKFFPPGTFVDASSMTPRELGKYLSKVASDKKLYAEMLWRKAHYTPIPASDVAWCQLCDRLHRALDDCHYDDMQAWWWGNARCHASSIF